ncbi:stage III sporulation protein AE [Hydrogenoanaerobacterium saccharovorans]|uniref:Stage III sporulation protein AE n=1 Tax=Hydrogenoanaerobacterium saccharovorans TaxID=474960 RepID=A0A1H7ZP06_9FIRM|nr:stage III sporulation protein AE [Hydrogenoanaerobacterium saccharovorans]RPF48483.1 stage III sporulation protein AE [Hydrogenoanaerobacterium saccharovorans]SEM60036.1 stage III sporulation protein AE [Hydrogenoanaerobacterium saccharovorans]
MIRRFFCMLLAFVLLIIPCYAVDTNLPDDQLQEQFESSGANELYDKTPDEAKEILDNLGVDKIDYKTLLTLSPTDFFKALWQILLTQLRKPLVILASITGVAVLCSLVEGLNVSIGQRSLDTVFNVVAILCICTAVVNPIVECIRSAAAAIQSCADFILSFIPVFVSLVAVGGQPVSATTYNTFLLLTSEVISKITANQLVPLVTIYLAFCIVGALTPSMNLSGAASTAKSIVTWALGLLVTVFVGLLGIQSLVASGADTVAMKTGKFLIGSFVPVVGKALSDALTTAQSCVKLLKTTVGAYAVAVASLTFLPSLLQTIVWYFAVNLGSTVSDVLGAQQIGKVLKACATALSLLLAIIAFVALLFIISTTIMLVVGMNI